MTGTDLRDLLERASADLPEVDLARRSWSRAMDRRRRRRRLAASTVAVVAASAVGLGIGFGVLPGRGDSVTPVVPGISTSTATAWAAGKPAVVDGASVTTGPRVDQIDSLTVLGTGLPARIGWTGTESLPTLRGGRQHVVAAMTGPVQAAQVPVLLVRDDRTLVERYVQVQVALTTLGGDLGNPSFGLESRAIDPTGTKVVYVQPTRVLIADVTTGELHDVRLPATAERLAGGGFADSGRVVVTSDTTEVWSMTGDGTDVRREPGDVSPWAATFVGPGRDLMLVGRTPDGQPTDTVPVRLPIDTPWGDTVGSRARAATGGFIDQGRLGGTRLFLRLFVAEASDAGLRSGLRAVLLIDDSREPMLKGGIRATAWLDDLVVFQYSTARRTWLLGWDPLRDEVFRVSEVTAPVSQVGTASQAVAIWPGVRGS